MNRIYKYTHRQKTTQSFLLMLPAVFVWVSALLWRFLDITLAKKYLDLNLTFPAFIQMLLWVVLPLWALFSAVQAYSSGTVHRYKRWNLLTIFFSVITLILFALTIVTSLI